jgi:hypothetical protein
LIFKRGSSFTLVLALAALLAACAYVVQRPTGGRLRSEAAIALARLPSPTPVRVSHVVDGDTFHVFVTLRSGEIVRAPLPIKQQTLWPNCSPVAMSSSIQFQPTNMSAFWHAFSCSRMAPGAMWPRSW